MPQDIIVETIKIAKEARMSILKEMLTALRAPREKTSEYAPRLLTIKINPTKIGKVIGPGGKGIRGIEADTGAKVEIDDDGTVTISCLNMEGAEKALARVEAVTAEIKVGKVYAGKIVSSKDFGAFVEIAPGEEGLCHISEIDTGFVKSVGDVVKFGEEVRVKVLLIDDQGRIKLSRKAAMEEESRERAEAR